jgi:hypothetical protein
MSRLNESDMVGHRLVESPDKNVALYRRLKEQLLRYPSRRGEVVV